eukprot:SM000041S15474  [mRNA]  locus=s41:280838:281567:+ [translate_table: standard]
MRQIDWWPGNAQFRALHLRAGRALAALSILFWLASASPSLLWASSCVAAASGSGQGTQEPSASDLRLLSRAHPLAPFSFRLRWACQLHICRSCDDEFRPRAQASALHQKAGRALVGGRRARFWHLVFMHRLGLLSAS